MRFSILLPIYKRIFLKECIESILFQTYRDFEIIIVNDASPEDLESIVFAFDDLRIRYYKNEKGFGGYNVVNNWNRCLDFALGDYVICMGDDDKLLPNCLNDYVEIIEKYPELDIYHMRTEIIDEKSQLIDMQEPRPEWESVYSLIWNLWKGRDQYIGDFLFRTSALKSKGGFYFLPYAWSSDKITAFVAARNKGIANTYNPGFQYRKHLYTITNSSTNQCGRFEALMKEKEWYRCFLADCKEPTDRIDKEYLLLIRLHMEKYMEARLESMIYWDITNTPSHYKYWKRNQHSYALSDHVMAHARYIYYKESLKKMLKY